MARGQCRPVHGLVEAIERVERPFAQVGKIERRRRVAGKIARPADFAFRKSSGQQETRPFRTGRCDRGSPASPLAPRRVVYRGKRRGERILERSRRRRRSTRTGRRDVISTREFGQSRRGRR
jgi:hypothetical protein